MAPVDRQRRVPDRVYAPVNEVEAPPLQSAHALAASDSDRRQLTPGDDSVLPSRERGDDRIRVPKRLFDPVGGLKRRFGGHPGEVDRVRRACGSCSEGRGSRKRRRMQNEAPARRYRLWL
jgi:hypothetical protein